MPSACPATTASLSRSRRISGWLGGVAAVLGLPTLGLSAVQVGSPSPAFAQTPPESESADRAAERLNEEGKKLVAQGKYEEALEKFRQSFRNFPLSNAIFNIGSMLYTLRRYEEAFPFLEQTLRAPLDPRQREIVIQYRDNVLNQLRATHAAILVETSPPGAKVTVNDVAMPFESPFRVLIPFGTADLAVSLAGFKPQTLVIQSSRDQMPKDQRIRLERDDPDAAVTIYCPRGADIFLDGVMVGYELVRTKLLLGEHTVRCGKTPKSKAFERTVTVKSGPNVFEFSTFKE